MGRAAFGIWLVVTAGCGRFGFSGTDPTGDGSVGGDSVDGDSAAIDDGAVPGVAGTVVRTASYGGTGNEEAYDITVASDGAIAITGTTDGGTFMIGGDTIASAGGEDILIAVFEPDGTPRWARRIGAAGGDRGQAIVVDSTALYVCGLWAGTVNFGGGNVTAAGMWDVFIASYSMSDGSFRWLQRPGGAGADFCYDLALSPAGTTLAATGYYEGTVNFGTGNLVTAGQREAFVATYNATTGTVIEVRGFASPTNDSGQGIAYTASGNIVATGSQGTPIDFGGGVRGTTNGSYLLELDGNLNHVWSIGLDAQTAFDVDVDRTRNRILVASRSTTAVDLGMGPLPAAGGNDNLILSYDSARQLEWYRVFGGDQSDIGLGITTDSYGNAYSIGLGGTNIDFGQGLVMGNIGSQDIWVAAHDPHGTIRWGQMFGGTPQDRGYGAAIAPDGALYVSGRWAGSDDFGTGMLTAQANDLFILRVE